MKYHSMIKDPMKTLIFLILRIKTIKLIHQTYLSLYFYLMIDKVLLLLNLEKLSVLKNQMTSKKIKTILLLTMKALVKSQKNQIFKHLEDKINQ